MAKKLILEEEAKKGKILARYKKHSIDILIDTVEINDKNLSRIFESVESALKLSQGFSKDKIAKHTNAQHVSTKTGIIFNQNMSCPDHEDVVFPELEPRLFSFNSPQGACPACEGLGTKKEIDPNLVIPDKTRTIAEGAIMPWSYKPNNYQGSILRAVTNYYRIPDNVRFRDLERKTAKYSAVMAMKSRMTSKCAFDTKTGAVWKIRCRMEWNFGIYADRYFKTESEAVRQDIEKYMSPNPLSGLPRIAI